MKKRTILFTVMWALGCMLASFNVAAGTDHLFTQPDATASPSVERTVHLLTVKNAFGWTDALEAEGATPASSSDTVSVDVTNCHGVSPLPDPLKLKFGQTAAYSGSTLGLFGAQCIDGTTYKTFAVIDLKIRNGDANLFTRAEYKTSIGKDLFDIPELPAALTHPACSPPVSCTAVYEYNRIWSGYDGQSTFLAFVNIGDAGNVRVSTIEDPAGTEWINDAVYVPQGDTFYELATRLRFGRLRIDIPSISFGSPGPKIYAVAFRGYKGAGVAKAVVPTLRLSIATP